MKFSMKIILSIEFEHEEACKSESRILGRNCSNSIVAIAVLSIRFLGKRLCGTRRPMIYSKFAMTRITIKRANRILLQPWGFFFIPDQEKNSSFQNLLFRSQFPTFTSA